MAIKFTLITEDEIMKVKDGLSFIWGLLDEETSCEIYLYALLKDENLIEEAKRAISESSDTESSEITIGSLVMILPLSDDVLHYFTGSGLKVTNENFVYTSGKGEGALSGYFLHPHNLRVSLGSVEKMALSGSDMYADGFLMQVGVAEEAKTEVAKRTEPAKSDNVTEKPAAKPATKPIGPSDKDEPSQPPTQRHPKASSLAVASGNGVGSKSSLKKSAKWLYGKKLANALKHDESAVLTAYASNGYEGILRVAKEKAATLDKGEEFPDMTVIVASLLAK